MQRTAFASTHTAGAIIPKLSESCSAVADPVLVNDVLELGIAVYTSFTLGRSVSVVPILEVKMDPKTEELLKVGQLQQSPNSSKSAGTPLILKSIKLISVPSRKALFEFDVREEFLNPYGQVSNGVLMTVTDAVTFVAASIRLEMYVHGVSLQLSVRNLKDFPVGQKVYVLGDAIKVGPKMVDCRLKFMDKNGVPLARGNQRIYMLPTDHPLAPKETSHPSGKSKL